jgi:hypothetical protein
MADRAKPYEEARKDADTFSGGTASGEDPRAGMESM